jgi:phosphoadenosine phosphosulfate reductase
MSERTEYLNYKFKDLDPVERITELFRSFDRERILVTSSFGTSSVYLLTILSKVIQKPKVHFIDTGYLFRETLDYLEELENLLDLDIIHLNPHFNDHDFTFRNRTWENNPDLCCEINKVNPLEKIKPEFDVWMTGLLSFQNDHRKSVGILDQQDILKFNPIIDVPKEEIARFLRNHQLPEHPLKRRGYGSVGCTHCTVPGNDRTGRWSNLEKTECGLHVEQRH